MRYLRMIDASLSRMVDANTPLVVAGSRDVVALYRQVSHHGALAEHDIIERGLAVLAIAVGRIDSGQPIPHEFPKWAPGFFAQFADKCHHAKEEDVFFPLLKQRGIPEQGGPIGVMLHERYDSEIALWEEEFA